MKIIGFSGVSGSGKSYRALEVAAEKKIKYIIDDGLLISGRRVIAGRSAKKEKTRLASVRCALFFNAEHADEVKKAIENENPESILILGTSHEMIEKIAAKLSLPSVSGFVEIEDVATKEEMEKAHQMRMGEGKHVIPVPTFEIKKDFSGYWIDALKKFSRKKAEDPSLEKTIIRPTFSYLGEFVISPAAICDIVKCEALKNEKVVKVLGASCRECGGGVSIKAEIEVLYGKRIDRAGKEVAKSIIKAVDIFTSINVTGVTVIIKSVVM